MSVHDLILTPTGLRYGGRRYPCSIGRGGLSVAKREGDGATPVGTHHIAMTLYRLDRICAPAPWARPIRPGDLWSDAPGAPDYNQWVRAPYDHSHEVLRRADPLYDLVLVTNWNWTESLPGAGSCIFIHQWRRPGYPTEGCIGLKRDDLHALAAVTPPGTRLIVRNR